MKKNKILTASIAAVLSLTLAGCSGSAYSVKGDDLMNIQKNEQEKENYLVIDVRDEAAYKEGHLKYAINIPVANIDKSIEGISSWREKKVVVYSDDNNKSKEALDKLTKQGFKNIKIAQNTKEYKYEFVIYTVLNGSKFQDAVLDHNANNFFLDARDKKDFEERHAMGAKNVDSKNLDNLHAVLPEDKNTPIYVYCYTGDRSSVIAQKLIDLGYKNVFNALDGTKEYNYKFEIADCCKDPSEETKGSEKSHEGHANHNSVQKDDHSGHNHGSDKKDDHSGHNHH